MGKCGFYKYPDIDLRFSPAMLMPMNAGVQQSPPDSTIVFVSDTTVPLGTCDDTIKNTQNKTILGFGVFEAVRYFKDSEARYQGHAPLRPYVKDFCKGSQWMILPREIWLDHFKPYKFLKMVESGLYPLAAAPDEWWMQTELCNNITLTTRDDSILTTQTTTFYTFFHNSESKGKKIYRLESHASPLNNYDYRKAASEGYPFARKYNPSIKFEGPFSELKNPKVKWFGNRLCRSQYLNCNVCDSTYKKCIQCVDKAYLYKGHCFRKCPHGLGVVEFSNNNISVCITKNEKKLSTQSQNQQILKDLTGDNDDKLS